MAAFLFAVFGPAERPAGRRTHARVDCSIDAVTRSILRLVRKCRFTAQLDGARVEPSRAGGGDVVPGSVARRNPAAIPDVYGLFEMAGPQLSPAAFAESPSAHGRNDLVRACGSG